MKTPERPPFEEQIIIEAWRSHRATILAETNEIGRPWKVQPMYKPQARPVANYAEFEPVPSPIFFERLRTVRNAELILGEWGLTVVIVWSAVGR